MKVYVNFGHDKLDQVKALAFDGVRTDFEGPIDYQQGLVRNFYNAGVRPIFLLHDVSLNAPLLDYTLPYGDSWFDIELWNEPPGMDHIDLKGYVDGINAVYADCQARGFKGNFIAGARANVDKDSMKWYSEAVPQLPPDVVVAFHRYSYKTQDDPSRPWPPFSSRVEEVNGMFRVAGGRKIAITEFGYHTAEEVKGKLWWEEKIRLTDQQVHDFLLADSKLYAAKGVTLAAIYQFRDGDTDNYLGRYGLHDQSDNPKIQSTVAQEFKAWQSQ